jgi:hypothetical protein
MEHIVLTKEQSAVLVQRSAPDESELTATVTGLAAVPSASSP